jgi:hypothetical protein
MMARKAREIPGWARAVEQSRRLYDHLDMPYAAAGEIVLPNAPAVADHAFAFDLAALLAKWAGYCPRLRVVEGGAT